MGIPVGTPTIGTGRNKIIDLTGKVFGRLTVLSYSHKEKRGAVWLCRCACGNEKLELSTYLLGGKTVSCGCFRRESFDKLTEQRRGNRQSKFGSDDLVGMRFGYLTVIERTQSERGALAWVCRCACGKTVIRETGLLDKSPNASCGCKQNVSLREDITGKKFGRLTALYFDESPKAGTHWMCRCDCGKETSVRLQSLKTGETQSCGCRAIEIRSRTGATTGIENARNHGKYAWHVMVGKRRLYLRSSHEVIVAKYMIKHHIRFLYEPERFQLTPSIIYIPDFYLPDLDMWVEVKGFATERWPMKRRLFENTGKKLLVVTQATINSYLGGISYGVWMSRNKHKYLRNP